MAEVHASTEVAHAPAGEHAEPTFLLWNAGGWVAIAMLVVFAILVWKRVPAAIGKALDKKIGAIRDQLAEAEALRKEAEQLKAEYAAKAAAAESEAAAMIERARHEADAMLEKAKQDADSLVERRTKMAEEKIAAEERAAVQQLRSAAADAASRAAARLISERVDADTDSALIDSAIKDLGSR
jgi:F-type H+-transporting ATPase subunit b